MKQTAVEWFYDQLEFDESLSMEDIDKLFQQAKEMEKEQIMDAWFDGVLTGTQKKKQKIILKKPLNQNKMDILIVTVLSMLLVWSQSYLNRN